MLCTLQIQHTWMPQQWYAAHPEKTVNPDASLSPPRVKRTWMLEVQHTAHLQDKAHLDA